MSDTRNLSNRENFKSHWGFILASIGSAVGMGNIWRFPIMVSRYGGLTYLIPYIIFVFLIGRTGVIEEFTLGRAAGAGPVGAFGMCTERRGNRNLGEGIGVIPVLGSLGLAIGYTVVMGWVFRYTFIAYSGEMFAMQQNMDTIVASFEGIAAAQGANIWIILAIVVTFVIMVLGVSRYL